MVLRGITWVSYFKRTANRKDSLAGKLLIHVYFLWIKIKAGRTVGEAW